ncbi:MFS transporter [Granulicella sp. WH15]|uniref:MFS transporter n=1 Tax=Granulicella sp. WH15 TaxID=2602070 RepID=UPI0013A5526D|nr:MFS transporter [Granulicella sp. WH15]
MTNSREPQGRLPDPGQKGVKAIPVSIYGTLLAFTLSSGIEQWTSTGLNVTLPDLTGTLGSSADEASWAITVYNTAFAVSVTLSHRLANRLGNRRMLSLACVIYALTSLGCALSPELPLFLCFRVLQGLAGGVFLARTLVFVTQRFEPKDRTAYLRTYGLGVFLIGRFASPILSGWFADNWSWRLLFLINVPAMLLAGWIFHRYTSPHWISEVEDYKPDIPGIALLMLGAAALQAALSRGEIDDWFGSNTIVLLTTIGIVCNLLFAAWQLTPKNRQPVLHLDYLGDRGVFSAAVLGVVLGMLLGGSLYVLPQYLRRVESHSALQTGVFISITGVATLVTLSAVQWIGAAIFKLGGKTVMAFALFVQMTAMGWFGHIVTVDTPDRNLWAPLILNGIFVGISVPTLAVAAFMRVDAKHVSTARAIYYGARQFGASLGVTAVVVLLDRRQSLHSSRLLEHFFGRNLSILGVSAQSESAIRFSGAITRQALVLTYADIFYTMAALAGVMLLFLPILPSTVGGAAKPAIREPQTRPQSEPALHAVLDGPHEAAS